MGFSAGRCTVTTSVSLSASIPAPGNAPAKTVSDPSTSISPNNTFSLTYGTSSGEADIFCEGEFTIAASSSLTLNLYDGGTTTSDLVRLLTGAAAALVTCKSLTIAVTSGGDTSGVTVGAAASNIFAGFFGDTSDTVTIYPSGPALSLGCPAGVTVSSTAKNLKLTNNSTTDSVTVQVTAVGTSVTVGTVMGLFPLAATYS